MLIATTQLLSTAPRANAPLGSSTGPPLLAARAALSVALSIKSCDTFLVSSGFELQVVSSWYSSRVTRPSHVSSVSCLTGEYAGNPFEAVRWLLFETLWFISYPQAPESSL